MSYHNFKDSLAVGVLGEKEFMALCPEWTRLAGRKADFVNEAGELLELKSDQYDMNKTANFFIEYFSDVDKAKVGGPWQALTHGSTYWVYYFQKNKTAYIFKTKELVDRLDTLVHSGLYKPVGISNRSWTTTGFKIPRSVLADLAEVKVWKK